MRRFRGSFWPSRTQELLLRTALGGPVAGPAAWQELRPGFDLTELEIGTFGVLPLAYRTVSCAFPEDPLLPRLKGIYRNSWVRNNLLVEQLGKVVDGFAAAGVQTIVVGSLAAAVRYYAELALRPTVALEFLVEHRDVVACARVLGRLGFSANGPLRPDRGDSIGLQGPDGQVCVLRTAPAVELQGCEETMRASAVEVQVGRSLVRALSPADDLLVACVSGARTRPIRSEQWLVDIAQIVLNPSGAVDWQRLLALAAAHGQALRLRETFRYLASVLEPRVPAEVDALLEELPVAFRDHIAYACAGSAMPSLGMFPQAIGEHLVATRRRSVWAAAATFPGFLAGRWELDHGWQLPLAGARRAYQRLASSRQPEA